MVRVEQPSFLAHDPNQPRNGPNRLPTLAIPSTARCSRLCFKGRRVSGTWRPCREHPPLLLPPPSCFFLGQPVWRRTRAASPSPSTPLCSPHTPSLSPSAIALLSLRPWMATRLGQGAELQGRCLPAKPGMWECVCAGPFSSWPRLMLPATRHGRLSRQQLSINLCFLKRMKKGTSCYNMKQLRVLDAKPRLI